MSAYRLTKNPTRGAFRRAPNGALFSSENGEFFLLFEH